MSVMTKRHRAVSKALDMIRAHRDSMGPGPELIDAVRPLLIELGLREDLFPARTFPVEAGATTTIYELSADADGRLGLYASAGLPGKYQPPHDHCTWSVIAGVRGAEWNRYYERTHSDDSEESKLEPRGELTIRAGIANGLMGDRFHSIEVIEEEPALHLHLYGDTLDRLEGRVYFETEAGGTARRFMARPDLHTALVDADELAAMVADDQEIAILDTRELGDYVGRHLLRAAPAPLSRLEIDAGALLPRRSVRVVVIGADWSAARRAGHLLRRGGYSNVALLDGGVDGWAAAGRTLHSGMGTFEKTFGEEILHQLGTPTVTPAEAEQMRAGPRPAALIDCRPRDEFRALRIPGAQNGPGMELLSCVEALGLDDDRPLIVTCAGRTRSLVGAQTLLDAGVPNPIVALDNGVMGWRLAGQAVYTDASPAPEPVDVGPGASRRAQERAIKLATNYPVATIDEGTLATWCREPGRTTYLFDVRSPDAYETGHRPEFLSAPGGQLLQELSSRAPVLGARFVLVDDDGTQAVLTAHWLQRMGREVRVLTDGMRGRHLVTGTAGSTRLLDPEPTEAISWHGVSEELASGTLLIDCSTSRAYRHGHIPRARHCGRSALAIGLADVSADRSLLFTSTDGVIAQYAASDAVAAGHRAAHLVGGNQAWERGGGHDLVASDAVYLVEPNDGAKKPYEDSPDDVKAMKAYLDWEIALVDTIDPSERAGFTLR